MEIARNGKLDDVHIMYLRVDVYIGDQIGYLVRKGKKEIGGKKEGEKRKK